MNDELESNKSALKQCLLIANSMGILSAYALVFVQWYFYTTKISFLSLSLVGPTISVATLAFSGLKFAVLVVIAQSLLVFATSLGIKEKSNKRLIILSAVPAVIFSLAVMTQTLNFTNTFFSFGMYKMIGWRRLAGALALLVTVTAIGYWICKLYMQKSEYKFLSRLAAFFVVISIPLYLNAVLATDDSESKILDQSYKPVSDLSKLPNIIILSSDAVTASHVSAYGYERDTTPFLKKIKSEFVFAENAFTNASVTHGSLTSLLTGRLPTQTKIMYSPGILNGASSFRHLPGILKKLGYRSLQFSGVGNGNAYRVNMVCGFDAVDFMEKRISSTTSNSAATIVKLQSRATS